MSAALTGISQAAQIINGLVYIQPKRGFYEITKVDGKTKIPDIVAKCTLEERHMDALEVTTHPVEQGAAITDHAFVMPSIVILKIGYSNSSTQSAQQAAGDIALSWLANEAGTVGQVIGAIGGFGQLIGNTVLSVISQSAVETAYTNILNMHYNRALFTLYTGKRIYANMICRMVSTETDYEQENSMIIVMECQEVLLVNTKTVAISQNQTSDPKACASPTTGGTQQATLNSASQKFKDSLVRIR